jgi:Chaperone of endosialidase
MNSTIQFKTTTRALLIALVLLCPAAAGPNVQAVVPPPDGGYPGFTTAEGQKALFSLTTGSANTAVGWFSLFSNAAGSFNTATGAGALLFNTADQNTAFGAAALLFNTTGSDNTATGVVALLNNTEGSNNTATGSFALQSNTTGNLNTATGSQALYTNTTGIGNTAEGGDALALNTTGIHNTAIGRAALLTNTSGSNNIALGNGAGLSLTTGDDNIDIGNLGVTGESDTIRIGNMGHTATYLAGIAGQTVGAGGSTCYVDNDGKLGVFLSARRFKTDIEDMGNASEALLALRPVTFHYKPELDKTCIPQFGLVAEEVAEVNPDLVTHDAKGKLSTVRYEVVNAMLLNEFLKEHRKNEQQESKIEEQEAKIASQQKQIEALIAGLQKVSAELELSKSASQTVLNNQ